MTSLSFKLNEKLDVKFHSAWWYTVTIIDISTDDKQIKIHYDYDGDNHNEDEWIDKTSNNLSKLHSHTLPITHISNPCDGDLSKVNAFYYKEDNKPYIILCIDEQKEIQKYDIQNATWCKICDYPYDFAPQQICFDDKNVRLHLLEIQVSPKVVIWCTFDLNDSKWTEVDPQYPSDQIGPHQSLLCFLPITTEKIHLFDLNNKHYEIILDLPKFVEMVEVDDNLEATVDNIVCYDYMQRLIALVRGSLWYCDVNKSNNNYVWYCYDIERIANSYYLILAYTHILFIFGGSCEAIYCFDLLHEDLYKTEREIPSVFSGDVSIVKGDGDYIYIIDAEEHYRNIRLSLLDIIPKALYDYYQRNVYNPLVFGFIAEMTKNKQLRVSVPFDIANLIFAFVPTFCEM